MTNATIRRLINNQKEEHSPHAFRAGGAGMADFNRLYPALRRLPAEEIKVGVWNGVASGSVALGHLGAFGGDRRAEFGGLDDFDV